MVEEPPKIYRGEYVRNEVFETEMFSCEILENELEVIVKIITTHKKKVDAVKSSLLKMLREKSGLGEINLN